MLAHVAPRVCNNAVLHEFGSVEFVCNVQFGILKVNRCGQPSTVRSGLFVCLFPYLAGVKAST